jgi:hypothetical protein
MFAVRRELSRHEMAEANFELESYLAADMAGSMVLELRAYIYCESRVTKKNQTIQYPTTWLDAFKVRWFPAWALKRWPAKWTIHLISESTVVTRYPDIPYQGRRIEVAHTVDVNLLANDGSRSC